MPASFFQAFSILMLLAASCRPPTLTTEAIDHLQGEMAGEVTASSALLQSRLTAPVADSAGDVPGRAGWARFEVSTDESFAGAFFTGWQLARADRDYIVKAYLTGLESGALYHYRLNWGVDTMRTAVGERRRFKTLGGPDAATASRFTVVTGMHYGRFRESPRGQQADAHLGYPALVAIRERRPDFFIGTGDNVYYDHLPPVETVPEMRKKWHEQFAQQRYHDLFAEVPTYWEKDDHDLRYDDCDSTDTPRSLDTRLPLPTFGEGQRLFREQLPLGDPDDPTVRPYRTHRVSMDMQIWLLEGRDFRSPNLMADGPEKTLWGIEQRAWLQETLLASDATFKIIVSPTPLVGPDDLRKKDNHTNLGGFRYEGDAFFTWAEANGFLEKGLYIVCGDRHWQYHAVHPTGFEEFSSGALVDGNARLGVAPGDPQGTDPQAQIQQRFVSPEPSGGFLEVEVVPGDPAILRFNFFDENGDLLYAAEKSN